MIPEYIYSEHGLTKSVMMTSVSKIKEISDSQIKEVEIQGNELRKLWEISGKHEESILNHEEVINRHEEVVNRHEEVVNRHEEVVNRHEEVVNRHEEVVNRHEEVVNRHEASINHQWEVQKWHEERLQE